MTRGVIAIASGLLMGCGGRPIPVPAKAATITNPTTEAALATVTLTSEAVARLGIDTALVERRAMARTRVFSGEVIVPPWREAHLTVPRAGYLLAPSDRPPPLAGQLVQAGDPLFRILPLPPEGDASRLEEDLQVAQARYTNAKARADRAQQLLADSVGTVQAVDDARVELISAEAQLGGARARLALVTGSAVPNDVNLPAIIVRAPFAGVIERVGGVIGTAVAAGLEIIEIGALDSLWIKVQLYVGEVSSVARVGTATVLDPARPNAAAGRTARPVTGPPSADPLASTADLYYAVANRDGWLRPHQRVGVAVPMKGAEQSLTVPWSAVVHDVQGATWVYQVLEAGRYARRRVDVRYVVGGWAVLATGPAPGTVIVTAGAAELFGTEFGPGT